MVVFANMLRQFFANLSGLRCKGNGKCIYPPNKMVNIFTLNLTFNFYE